MLVEKMSVLKFHAHVVKETKMKVSAMFHTHVI